MTGHDAVDVDLAATGPQRDHGDAGSRSVVVGPCSTASNQTSHKVISVDFCAFAQCTYICGLSL